VILPLLNIAKSQGDDFSSPQSTIEEERDDRVRRACAEVFQQWFPRGAVRPLRAEPVVIAPAELWYSFHSPDAVNQFWAQQAGTGRLVCQAAPCRLAGSLIVEARASWFPTGADIGATTVRFNARRGSEQYQSIEFNFIDSMPIRSAGLQRCETIEDGPVGWSRPDKVGRSVREFLRFVHLMRGGLRAAASLLYAAQ